MNSPIKALRRADHLWSVPTRNSATVGKDRRSAEDGAVRFSFGEYELDASRYTLRGPSGPVHLEPQVFDVLRYLIVNHDRVVSKEELLDAVWGSRFVSESALTTRVKAARRAIGDSGHAQRLIKTVHSRGYQFVGEVHADRSTHPVSTARRDNVIYVHLTALQSEDLPPGPVVLVIDAQMLDRMLERRAVS